VQLAFVSVKLVQEYGQLTAIDGGTVFDFAGPQDLGRHQIHYGVALQPPVYDRQPSEIFP